MKKIFLIGTLACFAMLLASTDSFDLLPALVGADVISTHGDEFGSAISPDKSSMFFSKKSPSTIGSNIIVLCLSNFSKNKWQSPTVAPFSGRYKDFNPYFSPDGNRLFFTSNRPMDQSHSPNVDIWTVDRTDSGWGEPKNMGEPINGPGYDSGGSMSRDGTLFFTSNRAGGTLDIYQSKLMDGKYQQPQLLPELINSSDYNESDVCVARDGSYILFVSTGRPDALKNKQGAEYPRADIYISFNKNGQWTKAENLGETVNSVAEEKSPAISPDGKFLYFTSERNFISIPMHRRLTYQVLENKLGHPGNGLGDIYRVDLKHVLSQFNH